MVAPASVPGVPDIVTTRFTPSAAAISIDRRMSCGVLPAAGGVRVERVAVAVQGGELDARRLELPEVVLPGASRSRSRFAGRWGAATNPPELISALVRPRSLMTRSASAQRLVVQDGGVDAQLHVVSFSGDLDLGAALGGGLGDGGEQPQVVQPVLEGRHRRQVRHAGDLLEERARLEREQVVLAVADAGEVHRQAAGEVGVRGADRDLAGIPAVGPVTARST